MYDILVFPLTMYLRIYVYINSKNTYLTIDYTYVRTYVFMYVYVNTVNYFVIIVIV